MKPASTLPVVLAILISGSCSAGAQSAATAMQRQQPKPGSSRAYTLRVDADEVVLNCTVLDNKGNLVNDLTKNNFRVFEDKILQTVISLQHQDTPVSIGMLVDDSAQ
jgi:Ca-activated chloride channel homolog